MSKRVYLLGSAAALACIAFAPETGSGSGGPDFEAAERVAKIRVALSKLDTAEDTHWTEGGLPAMDHMKAATGLDDLKRTEVSEASPGLIRAGNDVAKRGDAGPTGGDAEALKAEGVGPELWTEGLMPHDFARHIKDPIFLIEAAMAAMNADPRYFKNGELQAFMRHYMVAQPNIKAHQARLDKRYADAQKAAG